MATACEAIQPWRSSNCQCAKPMSQWPNKAWPTPCDRVRDGTTRSI
jgi:hypothetical protein